MTVHLLKNRSDDADLGRPDPYEELIPNHQFLPIMDYECINLEALTRAFTEDFDGIVVTSQRAVDSVKAVLGRGDLSDLEKATVLNKPVFTVGPTTAQRLEKLQFSTVNGGDTGNGMALATQMVNSDSIAARSRFLFVAGEIHRRQLPDKLEQAGHSVTTIIVYRTVAHPNIEDALARQVQDNDWIVFFSPSHTHQVLKFLKNGERRVRIAAIGPTTREFLTENGFEVHATAAEPSAQGLRDALTLPQ